MREIPIYRAEQALAELIQANASVAYFSLIQETPAHILSSLIIPEKVKADSKQSNLYYFDNILVSTGWNLNTDVFAKEEVWAARNTPKDQRLNVEHNENKIIGHIIGNYVVDDEGKALAETSVIDDLPDSFNIYTHNVAYKYWSEKDNQEAIDKIIDEIKAGEWCTSMEAIFTNFDYACIEGDKHYIVSRNEQTAFLTKHLRAYGGSGEHNGIKVGRLLRNLVFNGQGIVKRPANPKSLIVSASDKMLKFAKNVEENMHLKKVLGYINSSEVTQRENVMSKEIELQAQVTELQLELKSLKADKLSLEKSIKETDVKALEAKLSGLETKLVESQKLVAEKDEKILSSEKILVDMKAKSDADAKVLAEANKSLSEYKEKADKADAEKKTADRIASIAKELQVSDEDAKEMYNGVSELSDKGFASYLDSAKKYFGKKEMTDDEKKKAEDEKKKKAKADAEKALAEVKTEEAVGNSTSEGVQKVQADMQSFIKEGKKSKKARS